MYEIANCLDPGPSHRSLTEQLPRYLGKLFGIAIAASQQKDQRVFGQLLDRMLISADRLIVALSKIIVHRLPVPFHDQIPRGKACCDAVNRGPTWADGKLVFTLLDGEAVALDANTGKPAWRVRLGDPASGMTITMSPLVVGKTVLVGDSGGEMGVRGWLTALDADLNAKLTVLKNNPGDYRDALEDLQNHTGDALATLGVEKPSSK